MNKKFKMSANKNFWNFTTGKNSGIAELHIYGDIECDNFFTGKSDTSSKSFADELAKAGDVNEIKIYINSRGGDVSEGIGIYSQLVRHKAKKTVYIDGFACSIASVIAMAGDEIIMSNVSSMMIHNAWCMCIGNAEAMRKSADDLDKITKSLKSAYKSKINISDAELDKMMNDETWLTAEECIKYGFADRLLTENEQKQPDENPDIPEEEQSEEEQSDEKKEEKNESENAINFFKGIFL